MKVELLNPDEVKDLYKIHGEFACVCYDTPTEYAEKVGRDCVRNGHMSGSRSQYIRFRCSDVDRGTAEQCLRHEIGVRVPYYMQDNYTFEECFDGIEAVPSDEIVKNMASFRYIDKSGFKYETPKAIRDNEDASRIYRSAMDTLSSAREAVKKVLIDSGVDAHKAVEDANFLLPRATTTEFVIAFTPEALIHFMHKRLCMRAQEFIREMARLMKDCVETVNSEYAKLLVPQCQYLMWCPEGKRGCGAVPSKKQLKNMLYTSKAGNEPTDIKGLVAYKTEKEA